MVNKIDLEKYYLQNSEDALLDLPLKVMEDLVYRSLNIDYLISDRIRQNLLDTTKDCIFLDKSDFCTSVDNFTNSISFYISPRGGVLIKDGAIEDTFLNRNTVKFISSKYIKDNGYDYSKVFECVVNVLDVQNINSFIEGDRIVIDLNQFRNCKI